MYSACCRSCGFIECKCVEFNSLLQEAKDHKEQDANPITKPNHYTRLSPEPLDVIDSWGLPFYEAQVLKYIARAGHKGGEGTRLQDLQKAAFYLSRRIKQLGG